MGVKENVMIAGSGAVVIGVGKALTRDVDIPGWLWLVTAVPVVLMLGFAGYFMYQHWLTMDDEPIEEPKPVKRRPRNERRARKERRSRR